MMATSSDSPKAKPSEKSRSLDRSDSPKSKVKEKFQSSGSPKTFKFLGRRKRDTISELHHPQDEKVCACW